MSGIINLMTNNQFKDTERLYLKKINEIRNHIDELKSRESDYENKLDEIRLEKVKKDFNLTDKDDIHIQYTCSCDKSPLDLCVLVNPESLKYEKCVYCQKRFFIPLD